MVPRSSRHQWGLPPQQDCTPCTRHPCSTASAAALQPPNEALKLQKRSREQQRRRARGCCQLAAASPRLPERAACAGPPAPPGHPQQSPTSHWLPPPRVGTADASRNTLGLQAGAWLSLSGFSFRSYCTICVNTQLPFLPGVSVTELSCSHTNHRGGWASSSWYLLPDCTVLSSHDLVWQKRK